MELPFDSVIPLLGIYPKNCETPIQKNLCTPLFIAVQCPSVDEWIKKLVHLHNGIIHSGKKEGTPTFCDSIDGTGDY